MDEHVLILGGGGFIGSHLAEKHVELEDHVTVVDTFHLCYPDNLDAVRKRIAVQVADVSEWMWSVPRTTPWDRVYMLAGVVSTADFVKDPLEAFWSSVGQVRNVMNYLLDEMEISRRPIKVLFASSSEVYGNPTEIPTPERNMGQVDCRGLRSGYDEGKRAAETLIVSYRRMCAAHCATVRIFNTFGPRMRANGRLVPTMIKSALEEGVIRVNKPGIQTRTLLYVDDCVEALVRACELMPEEAVNVGGVETMTMWEVAELVEREIPCKIEVAEEIAHDIGHRKPDLRLAKGLLNWEPTTKVADGVHRTVEYWRPRLEAKR